jgi:hypothetical protein
MLENLLKVNFAGGKTFLELTDGDIKKQIAFAENKEIDCFQITSNLKNIISDLSFLDTQKTKGIFIQFENVENNSDLNRFENLEILAAGYLSYPNGIIDLENFLNIKILNINWNNNFINIDKLDKTIRLNLWKFQPKSRTLLDFITFKDLAYATLTMATIDSLNGIESIQKLKELDLRNIKTLKSFFTDPTKSKLQLEELNISCCKNLNLETLPHIDNLKILNLSQMGKIVSIEPLVHKFPNLEILGFTQSELIDGNIEYLKKFTKLKKIFIDNKKHYSLKENEINNYLKTKAQI